MPTVQLRAGVPTPGARAMIAARPLAVCGAPEATAHLVGRLGQARVLSCRHLLQVILDKVGRLEHLLLGPSRRARHGSNVVRLSHVSRSRFNRASLYEPYEPGVPDTVFPKPRPWRSASCSSFYLLRPSWQVCTNHHPRRSTAAGMATCCDGAGAGGRKAGMLTWVPPPALGEGGLTEMLDRMYPLKVFNSLTRTKV